jgi:hypothetical protein
VSSVKELLHFDDPDWQKASALDLIGEYLAKLGPIVDEAERRFRLSEER